MFKHLSFKFKIYSYNESHLIYYQLFALHISNTSFCEETQLAITQGTWMDVFHFNAGSDAALDINDMSDSNTLL